MSTRTLPAPTIDDPTVTVVRPASSPTGSVGRLVEQAAPNWFAAVMGTGIVAVAAVGLPVHHVVITDAARAVWLVAAMLLVGLVVITVAQWRRHPERARGHLADPVRSHFYGAPAMAVMTVGAGTGLLGQPILGAASWPVAGALWAVGTVLGLITAVVVPYRAFTGHEVSPDAACGGWLMPVVPPMVSAATGAALVPLAPDGQPRLTLLLACYAMFGLTLLATMIMIVQLWQRLVHHGVGAATAVPTLWIVLGPLGQSITAAHLLGDRAAAVIPGPAGQGLAALAVVYGVPALGFASLWLALAFAVTLRTIRSGLPFTLTWWSFTFPVGTLVTATSGLTAATGSLALGVLAVIAFVGLVTAWVVVSARTVAGLVRAAARG